MSAMKLLTVSKVLHRSSLLSLINSINVSRHLATKISQTNVKSSDWEPIYKFRYIAAVAGVNKLKVYQAIGIAATVPISASFPDIVPATAALGVGVSGLATLIIASFLLRNTIGFIYTSKKHDDVKLSFVDFWGKRKEVVMSIDEVVPLSELPKKPFDSFYSTLQFYNGNERLKLVHKFGGINNATEFAKVFGVE